MGHVHQQEPAEEHADTSSPSSRPQGSGLDSLQPWLLSLLLYTLVQQSKISVCGASSFKNIKYKTLPYSISNHSIYKFIFSKKKKKVKDTVIQHNSSFSFLLWTSLKRNFRSRKESGARLPSRGAPGELDSPSVWRFSAQSHSGKDIQRWKILGTLFFGGQVNWNIQADRRQASTRPIPFWQEILFLKRYPSHRPCPNLLVSFWIAMA